MKCRPYIALTIALISLAVISVQAAFTSFYVFGDCLSTATPNSAVGPGYYGDRWSNGRVWVEVLAKEQGLPFNLASNTNAYFGNTSRKVVSEINNFSPPNPAGALVVIWVNNADMYYPATTNNPSMSGFTSVINQAQVDHYNIITNLYAKGVRTLIMPNAVDISTVPGFNKNPAYANMFHQASVNYNTAFYATLNQAQADCPGLTIIVPDYYALLNDLLANSADYGLTNALRNGVSIDALAALGYSTSLTSGPGTNYIFWDSQDPTAKVHYIMANVAQQLISPVRINKVVPMGASNRLDVINMPVSLIGYVDGTTNLSAGWMMDTNTVFTGTTTSQSIFVQAPVFNLPSYPPNTSTNPVSLDPTDTNNISSGTGWSLISAAQFYQLRFPANWTWP